MLDRKDPPQDLEVNLAQCMDADQATLKQLEKGVNMAKIDARVKEFLDQKKIAVVGVSDKCAPGCKLDYCNFTAAGYTVFAVNPRRITVEGAPRYSDLKSIPNQPDARRVCCENGRAVIPGRGPNQLLQPDFDHKVMRRLWRTFGCMRMAWPALGHSA